MKNKIPTAEELCRIEYEDNRPENIFMERSVDMKWAIFMMKQFAKIHVIEALKQASEKAKINTEYYHEDDVGRTKLKEILDISPLASERTDEDGLLYAVDTYEINKDSILNAYPLNLIK